MRFSVFDFDEDVKNHALVVGLTLQRDLTINHGQFKKSAFPMR